MYCCCRVLNVEIAQGQVCMTLVGVIITLAIITEEEHFHIMKILSPVILGKFSL